MKDDQGDPWFVAKDVCDVLGVQPKHMTLDEDEQCKVDRTDLGFSPGSQMTLINESGLYSLILRSRKPIAKAFKKWVTGEVLPSTNESLVLCKMPTSRILNNLVTYPWICSP